MSIQCLRAILKTMAWVCERKVAQSCPTLCDPMDCSPTGSSVHGDSPGENTGVGFHALLQGIFPMQGWNPGLPCCGQILYQLSHQEGPRILEWVACPFSRGSSQPRSRTGVSFTAGWFFTNWVTREAPAWVYRDLNKWKSVCLSLSLVWVLHIASRSTSLSESELCE